jgi:hypothetical protein
MDNTNLFIIAIAIVSILLITENLAESIQGQNASSSKRLVNIINETNSNSTIDVLNKSLPAQNATKAIPVAPVVPAVVPK